MLSRDQSTVLVLGGDGPLGSGYLLSHGTVLTAYHVARSASWVDGGQIGRLDATVVWTDPDRDLALIETSMPDEAGYQAPLGILASRAPGIPVEVLAYPAAQRDDGKVRLEQVTGFVNPISGGPDDLHITVNSGVWMRPAQGSPWAGASGGPVFANGVLVGVVTHGGTDINRLKATRLDTMLMDPRALRLLAKHRSLGRIICAGAEFGGIVRQPTVGEVGPTPLPSVLLDPRRETVPFRGRDVTLAEIEAWLTGSGVRIGVITGAIGDGKTRVAQEVVRQARQDGWLAVSVGQGDCARLVAEGNEKNLEQLRVPTLLIVDDIEDQLDALSQLISSLGYNRDAPVRVLICSRALGWWTQSLVRNSGALRMDELKVFALEPDDSPAAEVSDEFMRATKSFHRWWCWKVRGRPQRQIPLFPIDLPSYVENHFGDGRHVTALDIHLESLCYALAAHETAVDADFEMQYVEREIYDLANRMAKASVPIAETDAALGLAIAALYRPRTEADGRRVLAGFHPKILDVLRGMYPGMTTSYIEAMPVRRLADYLITERLMHDTDRLLAVFQHASSPEQARALSTVFRLADADQNVRSVVGQRLGRAAPNLSLDVAASIAAVNATPNTVSAVLQAMYPDHRGDVAEIVQAIERPGSYAANRINSRLWAAYQAGPPDLGSSVTLPAWTRQIQEIDSAISALTATLTNLQDAPPSINGLIEGLCSQVSSVADEIEELRRRAQWAEGETAADVLEQGLRNIVTRLDYGTRREGLVQAVEAKVNSIRSLQELVGPVHTQIAHLVHLLQPRKPNSTR